MADEPARKATLVGGFGPPQTGAVSPVHPSTPRSDDGPASMEASVLAAPADPPPGPPATPSSKADGNVFVVGAGGARTQAFRAVHLDAIRGKLDAQKEARWSKALLLVIVAIVVVVGGITAFLLIAH